VYAWALWYHLIGRFGPHDVVIDVQNGVPFFAPLYCRKPVLCLVHHIHREQWSMNFSPRQARLGWWIESRLSSRVYRDVRHIAVSESTRRELMELGTPAQNISVVHNGSDPMWQGASARKAPGPTVAFLGRLVPHKRVELLIDAAARLLPDIPDLRVLVIGQGPWEPRLRRHAVDQGVEATLTFTGWVDEPTKHRLLGEAWVLALPSVKEGWGLAVMEAAVHGTPAVAFRVGGLGESIDGGRTGLLVEDQPGFVDALRDLLMDADRRKGMGMEAVRQAALYSWEATASRFEVVIADALEAEPAASPMEPVVVPAASEP
jgi:glycosyltransferase involved in cell wall biosynthesis